MGLTRRSAHWTVLAPVLLLSACYAMDSATSACQHNPAYCAVVLGEETVVPAVRGGAEIASLAAVHRLLSADIQARLEQDLMQCAELAEAQVNQRYFGGGKPSLQQCQEWMPQVDPCGARVTRAMQLGTEKHLLALDCAQTTLGTHFAGRFSLEQRYRADDPRSAPRLITEDEARALLQRGCGEELRGTLRPDVVIHSGDPRQVLAIYDFKFPCPSDNAPSWKKHTVGAYRGSTQGRMYAQGLKAQAALIAPGWGVRQRIQP